MHMIFVALAFVALASAAPQGAPQPPIPILRSVQDQNFDGGYVFGYETGNKITVDESSVVSGDVKTVKGSFSYVDPDGQLQSIQYSVAADGGFRAEGNGIPQAPLVPELPAELRDAVAKAVAKAAAEDAKLSAQDLEQVATGKWLPQLWANQA